MNYEAKIPIKLWAEDDRPREKLILKGKQALSDAELLAILIGSGTRTKSAVDIARELLDSCKQDISALARLSVKELCKVPGIGPARAVNIVAGLELAARKKRSEAEPEKIAGSQDVFQLMESKLSDISHEEFWVLYLNRANKVIEEKQISSGGISGTVADPRIILRYGLELKASSLILCHNHPSGNLKASEADLRLTRKIKEGALLMDMQVLDHLILVADSYLSFADEGIL
ncbi:MAG: DNA repair protein RadC [Bacteroidetes bacterium]|nr:MAG: DNA repair protein RadC [Bacteroidota bacterium]